MPVEAQNPQVNTVGNSAPPSSESYVAAAMEALKNAPVDPNEPVLGDEKVEAPVEKKEEAKANPLDEKKVETKDEKKTEKKEEIDNDPGSDTLKKSFEKLAKGNAELREKEEKLKPLLSMAERLDPNSLSAIARAVQMGDPVSALAALGFSHHDYASTIANGKQPQQRQEKREEESDASPADQRIANLERQLAEMNLEKGRARAMEKVAALAKDSVKFEYVAKLGEEAQSRALTKLEEYYGRVGKLPADNLQDSLALALESVEGELKTEAAKWKRLLTPAGVSSTVTARSTEATEFQSRAESSKQATSNLTNSNATAPSKVSEASDPKTPEEYQRRTAALLAKLNE